MLINVGGAATEEPTDAAATGQTPGKTVAIAERSALSTDFPLWAERYPSGRLCLVFDPAKASLTDAVKEAATPLVFPTSQAKFVIGGFATSSASAFLCVF